MSDAIPLVDLAAQYRTIRGEVRAAVDDVLESGQFILGQAVTRFEREAAACFRVRHAVVSGAASTRSGWPWRRHGWAAGDAPRPT